MRGPISAHICICLQREWFYFELHCLQMSLWLWLLSEHTICEIVPIKVTACYTSTRIYTVKFSALTEVTSSRIEQLESEWSCDFFVSSHVRLSTRGGRLLRTDDDAIVAASHCLADWSSSLRDSDQPTPGEPPGRLLAALRAPGRLPRTALASECRRASESGRTWAAEAALEEDPLATTLLLLRVLVGVLECNSWMLLDVFAGYSRDGDCWLETFLPLNPKCFSSLLAIVFY